MSFGEYAAFLRRSADMVGAEIEAVSAVVAENAAIEARHMMGNKQEGWDDLRPKTVADKIGLGFAPPDYQPLLRTAKTRDEIEWISTSLGGVIGSNSKVMFWHEFGTTKMAPRPVLGMALLRMMPLLEELLGEVAVKTLMPITR